MSNPVPIALLLALLGALLCRRADAIAFEVGGDDGWVVPPANDGGMYNHWASENRFLVGDSVHFKYEEDSVMVVTEQDYNSCQAPRPIFFSNNGDTQVELDRPGLFYIISGATGHCERGQRMTIKVIGQGAPPPAGDVPPPAPPSPPTPSSATPSSVLTGAIAVVVAAVALPIIVHGV